MHVLFQLSRLHIKDIDEHLNIAEYVVSLTGKVVLHEGLLATTVPQVQHQVSKEADMGVLNINCQERNLVTP